MLEQAGDGTWTAAIVGEHSVLGTGQTKESAVEDLRRGVTGLMEYLKTKGGDPAATFHQNIELVNIEIAA
ncbi:MAG: hypothetical protein FWD64_11520 [Acidobacteriaceae bacterium]|nr:hypothetical protein [Acidobacteriaceae bacterium]